MQRFIKRYGRESLVAGAVRGCFVTYPGSMYSAPVPDASPFAINSADDSKKVRVDLSGLAPNTTAIISITGNIPGGGVVIGAPVSGGVAGDVLYVGAGSVLAQATGITFAAGALDSLVVANSSTFNGGTNIFGIGQTGALAATLVVNGGSGVAGGWGIYGQRNTVNTGFVGSDSALAGTNDSSIDVYSYNDNVNIFGAGVLSGVFRSGTFKTGSFIVSTLPAGATGQIAYITDQTGAPAAKGVAPVGTGVVSCYVYYDGSAWVGI